MNHDKNIKTIEQPSLKKYLLRMVSLIAGGLFCAVAVNIFYYPYQFLNGGLSGISLVIDYLFNIPMALTITILNIPIFILAFKELDFHFAAASFVGMISYSLFIHLLRPLIGALYVPDEILAAIFGGAFNGVGLGIILRSRASVGGTDILAVVLRRKWSLQLGNSLFFMNLFIVSIGVFFFPLYKALYSIIGMFVTSYVIDRIIHGFDKKLSVMIMSEKWELVADYINNSLFRGATLLSAQGAYKRKEMNAVYTVIPAYRISKLKDAVSNIDPEAFVSVAPANEIMGNWMQGFTKRRHRVYKKDD